MSIFYKYKKPILVVTLLFFLGGVFYVGASAVSAVAPGSAVATVGKGKVKFSTYETLVNLQLRQLQQLDIDLDNIDEEELVNSIRAQVLSSMITEEALYQSADKAGIGISDYEIAYEIKSSPMFNYGGIFSKQIYTDALRQTFKMHPSEYEEFMKHSKMAQMFATVSGSVFRMSPEETAFVYQSQHGNMKDYDKNKALFEETTLEGKLEAGQKIFFTYFNDHNVTEIKDFMQNIN
ncbi:SurA N-terminal domain-containing protein [Parelusimicrobium proximum]|uniref:SurA N-terminal domain-containing protein n=1 Tax=Parelusimicrobium proximum TaxID=3228953 RepID=UPI003D164F0D